MSTKQLLCRYFTKGTCNYGDGCLYSHNPTESVIIPEDTCLFFLRSNCMYGDTCRMKHRTFEEIVEQSQNAQQQQESEEEHSSTTAAETTSNESRPNVDTSSSSRSYALVASTGTDLGDDERKASIPLCTFFQMKGFCVYQNCSNIHGKLCDLCGCYSMHPYNKEQSDQHRNECIKAHEECMEISFAYQRSKDLICSICLDVILEKEPRKNRRFGILENCAHIYCIECIRKWRNTSEDIDKKNKRNCPSCRVKSDFIIPSEYFYDDKDQKQQLIDTYKKALGSKHCKYFKQGKGKCPFAGACFYKHEYPDGRKAEMPMPSNRRRPKNIRVDLTSLLILDNSIFDDLAGSSDPEFYDEYESDFDYESQDED